MEILDEGDIVHGKDDPHHSSSIISRKEYETIQGEFGKHMQERQPGGFDEIKTETNKAEIESILKKTLIINALIYVVVSVFTVLGGVALFIFADRELSGKFLQRFSKNTVHGHEKISIESITVDDRNREKAASLGIIEDSGLAINAVSVNPLPLRENGVLERRVYSVHAGVYFNKENAVIFSDNISRSGYDAYIRKVIRTDNKTIYRVLIGIYHDKNKALEQSEIIRKKEGIDTFVYHYLI